MQKFTAILIALVFVAFSCGDSVEKYRANIEKLSTDWQETTNMVTELLGKVQGDQAKAQSMMGQMTMPEGFAMTPENSQKAQELKSTVQNEAGKLGQMAQTIAAFAQDWTTKSAQVEALTGSLTSGEVAADTQMQIDNLKTSVDEARSKVDEWQSAYSDATDSYNSAYDSFMDLMPEDAGEGN